MAFFALSFSLCTKKEAFAVDSRAVRGGPQGGTGAPGLAELGRGLAGLRQDRRLPRGDRSSSSVTK